MPDASICLWRLRADGRAAPKVEPTSRLAGGRLPLACNGVAHSCGCPFSDQQLLATTFGSLFCWPGFAWAGRRAAKELSSVAKMVGAAWPASEPNWSQRIATQSAKQTNGPIYFGSNGGCCCCCCCWFAPGWRHSWRQGGSGKTGRRQCCNHLASRAHSNILDTSEYLNAQLLVAPSERGPALLAGTKATGRQRERERDRIGSGNWIMSKPGEP